MKPEHRIQNTDNFYQAWPELETKRTQEHKNIKAQKHKPYVFTTCGFCTSVLFLLLWFIPTATAQQDKQNIYVPQKDLPALLKPQDKAVLMDRKQFETLLAAAQAGDKKSGGCRGR